MSNRAFQLLGILLILLYLIVELTRLPNILAQSWETTPGEQPAEAIVVLGSSVQSDERLDDTSLRRTIHGIELYRKGLSSLLVFMGTRKGKISEAQVRAHLAMQTGVPPESILAAAEAPS